ncbi:MAG: MAPEG family protein [Colwellia sp.]
MPVTFYFAAMLAIFYLYLSFKVIFIRKEVQVAIGDGGSDKLARAIRVHANFSEYVPLTLLLLYFLETQNANAMVISVLGGLLLVARVVHAYGVSEVDEQLKFRIFGMFTTMGVIIVSALYLLLIGVGLV